MKKSFLLIPIVIFLAITLPGFPSVGNAQEPTPVKPTISWEEQQAWEKEHANEKDWGICAMWKVPNQPAYRQTLPELANFPTVSNKVFFSEGNYHWWLYFDRSNSAGEGYRWVGFVIFLNRGEVRDSVEASWVNEIKVTGANPEEFEEYYDADGECFMDGVPMSGTRLTYNQVIPYFDRLLQTGCEAAGITGEALRGCKIPAQGKQPRIPAPNARWMPR